MMKAARLYDLSDIRIEDMPIPEIRANEALVRMKACGICGSDTMDWYVNKKAPYFLGHEPAGVIERVGSEVKKFKEGDRVFVHHHAPCFECKFCRRKQYSLCLTWKASKLEPGGMADFFRVPAVNLNGDTLKLPDRLTFEDGALIEPTACVVKSLRKASLRGDERVLVIGLGVMGQMHIVLAKHYGVHQIIGADLVPYRLQKAVAFGADTVVDVRSENLVEQVSSVTSGSLADLVIVGPGSTSVMKTALQCVGKGGTVLFFTPTRKEDVLQLSPFDLYFNEIDLICSYSCGPDDTREALSLIERGVINADRLVTHRFPLEKIQEAFEVAIEARDSLKILMVDQPV